MQHVVRAWEFLAAIASQHGTTVRAILAANPQITDPELVFPGQVIALPVDGEPGPAATYLVRSGDTMGKIARTFDVATAALIAANPQVPDPNRIRPGQVLNLPAGARRSDDVTSATRHGLVAWLAIARREMDTEVDEIPGSDHNQRILEYHATTTLPSGDAGRDETPWCSSFVN
ncbi:hypothetical protein BH24ACT7_BH24ACT7_15630 [soil metagenome]